MTGRAPLLTGLAAIVMVATGVLLWLGSGDPADSPPPAATENGATDGNQPKPNRPPASTPATVGPAATVVEREPVTPPLDRAPAVSREDFPQGLEGRVVDQHSQALPNVEVYLVESPKNDPLTLPALRAQGLLMGPVATTRTAADGAFALGLALPTDKLYELRFLAPGWADAQVGDLKILPSEWHDVGRVTLRRGTTLRGQVTIAGTAMPVRGAIVTVAAPTSFDDAVLAAIPGREQGLHAITGLDGTYRLEHAPENAVVAVSASAPGFARVIQPEINLSKGSTIEVHFALPAGVSIAGRVVDARGQGIPGARLEAWAKATSTPPCTTISRTDGSFEIDGLRAEPHRIRVLSRTHQGLEVENVAAGERELELRLLPRAIVRVRAHGNGQVLTSFRLGLRRFHAARSGEATAPDKPAALGQLGRVRDLPDRRARLVAGTDQFEIRGVPPGDYVAQVTAPGFAKTVSESFTVESTSQAVDVEVHLTRGAMLRGRVVDANGTPLANATITTQPDGARPDNPFYRMIAPAAPDRITARTITTGPDGTFELRHLAFGDYQLELKHREACREFAEHLYLRDGTPLELGDLRLRAGTLVFGRATTNGRTTGQVKVVLTTYVDRKSKSATPPSDALRLETVTDSTGAFTLPRRVPPGEYELRAAAIDASNPDAQVFQHMLQMAKSATRVTIRPGQRAAEQHLNIASDG